MSPCSAQSPDTRQKACDQTLNACDQALNKAGKALKDQQGVIKLQKEEMDALAKALAKTESENRSIFRNPFLWLFIGMTLGGLGVGYAVHH